MKQISIEEYLKSAEVEWKPIPKDATVIIPGRRVHGLNMIKTIMEQRVMNEPDVQICGSIDGKPAIIGFKEWVSGPDGCFTEWEAIQYREILKDGSDEN